MRSFKELWGGGERYVYSVLLWGGDCLVSQKSVRHRIVHQRDMMSNLGTMRREVGHPHFLKTERFFFLKFRLLEIMTIVIYLWLMNCSARLFIFILFSFFYVFVPSSSPFAPFSRCNPSLFLLFFLLPSVVTRVWYWDCKTVDESPLRSDAEEIPTPKDT